MTAPTEIKDRQDSTPFTAVLPEHWELRIRGTVQGVGFRPFVFNLARAFNLWGAVWNDTQGVVVRVQGAVDNLLNFTAALRAEAPAAARIDEIETRRIEPDSYTEFRILPSRHEAETFTQVSADLAICRACWRELEENGGRRRAYPFTNCTNCGPRFTIIRALPYDRPLTTMAGFRLCAECAKEYEDPADRRFHAQPIACPACGPKLRFLLPTAEAWAEERGNEPALHAAGELLRKGGILVVQGIGGFHLACDARAERTVRELRRRKHRDEKPFAVMFPTLERLAENCLIAKIEQAFLQSYRAPILLLRKRPETEIADGVAPGNPYLGAMLPYSPLHVLLLAEFGGPLVMTSANQSDEPICYLVDDALERMEGIADAALVHDRAIHMFADDSVVKVTAGKPRVWRRSRGYVPEAVHVPRPFRKETLAFGPQLKNTFCLGKRSFAILSQHLGDLERAAAFEAQRVALEHFVKLFDAKIELAACDMHPDYASTHVAEEWCEVRDIPLVRVQHHHAHLAACLAENGTCERAIGLCLDGTGYGSDGTIWGGEVLVGDFTGFERAGHLLTVPMPGGEKAAQEPWRMALAWLTAAVGEECSRLSLPLIEELKRQKGEAALQMLLHPGLKDRIYPRTSSLGRLFDAVAALLCFGARRQYEGQAAMLLEGMATPRPLPGYSLEIVEQEGMWVISPLPMLRDIVRDMTRAVDSGIIAWRFHEGLVKVFGQVCQLVRETSGLNTVALSGGCFQNSLLLEGLEAQLTTAGFKVLSHEQVPANDGGVALGQAVVANAQAEGFQ